MSLALTGHRHNIVAELLRIRSGHDDILPATLSRGHRSDVNQTHCRPLVVLDRTDQTNSPGIYNLWIERGGESSSSPHCCAASFRRVMP